MTAEKHTNLLKKNGEPHLMEVFKRTLLKETSEIAISGTYDMSE